MTSPDLAALVTGFFVRYLAAERNVSPHTTAAYRDTLKLLLRFARDGAHRPVTALRFEDLTPDLIRSFLDHLETARHNTVRTRNARLAAIHSFMRYVFDREPGLATICQRILTIPVKKTTRPVLGYPHGHRARAPARAGRPLDTRGGARLSSFGPAVRHWRADSGVA